MDRQTHGFILFISTIVMFVSMVYAEENISMAIIFLLSFVLSIVGIVNIFIPNVEPLEEQDVEETQETNKDS